MNKNLERLASVAFAGAMAAAASQLPGLVDLGAMQAVSSFAHPDLSVAEAECKSAGDYLKNYGEGTPKQLTYVSRALAGYHVRHFCD